MRTLLFLILCLVIPKSYKFDTSPTRSHLVLAGLTRSAPVKSDRWAGGDCSSTTYKLACGTLGVVRDLLVWLARRIPESLTILFQTYVRQRLGLRSVSYIAYAHTPVCVSESEKSVVYARIRRVFSAHRTQRNLRRMRYREPG